MYYDKEDFANASRGTRIVNVSPITNNQFQGFEVSSEEAVITGLHAVQRNQDGTFSEPEDVLSLHIEGGDYTTLYRGDRVKCQLPYHHFVDVYFSPTTQLNLIQ